MFLSSLSVKRPVLVSMVLAALILFGVLAFLALPLNFFPNVEFPFIVIQTVYPGASPDQIETQITKRIEDEVATISSINYINSFSLEGASIIIMRFELSKDQDVANQEVKSKIDAIKNDLPDDAYDPVVDKFDIQAIPVVDVMLSGNIPMQELYDIADSRIKELLSQIENVGNVSLTGGQSREIRVEFENRTVYQNGISLAAVNQILSSSNLNMPAGTFKNRGQEYSVKLDGEFLTIDEIRELNIMTSSGQKKLGEVAEVSDSVEEIREKTIYYDNKTKTRNENAILLSIVKSPEGNAVKIAESAEIIIDNINRDLPAGVTLEVVNQTANYVESSVNDTMSNIIMGIVLTSLILLFFLHDLRSTLIVALTMPFSLIPTFLIFQVMGFSLNMMTLMGLSTSVGVLVMNSVVILENIFRHKELGQRGRDAALIGTNEVTVAVIASTLTNIAVFLPLAAMGSMVGMFLKEFALAVVFATIFSLLIAFTLTPMMASLLLPERAIKKNPVGQFLEKMFAKFEKNYKHLLELTLKTKLRSFFVVAATIGLFVFSMGLFKYINFEFMPSMDEGEISITVEMPQGYDLTETSLAAENIEQRLTDIPELKHVITQLGKTSEINTGTNMAILNIKLVDKGERELSNQDYASIITSRLADIPGVEIKVAAVSGGGGGGGKPIDFYLVGHDISELERYKEILFNRLKKTPGFLNLDTSSRAGKPEITIIPDRKKTADAGLTISDIAFTVRSAIEGMVMTQYREGGKEYDIRVVLKDDSVKTYEDVKNIMIAAPSGIKPVSHFAEVKFTTGYNKILHNNKSKAIEFTADIAPGFAQSQLTDIVKKEVDDLDLPFGYRMVLSGDAEEMENTNREMVTVFIIAIVLTYMLLAAILEKLFQPLLILFTVPLSLIGVVYAFLITGINMNFISMMAIIMLVGLVVNNAILILDYANQLTKKGLTMHEALLEACPTKLKPIVMANLATILGMLPMALGLGSSGAEIRQPMGIVSIGGLVASTVLSLFVIPAIENLLTRRKIKGMEVLQ
ncbi:MAG: efflux RND transporter permease subunit [Spirochaetia bacterium]|jgi:HAE1 family hydrophobic/amphiphilic exporter-1|nr:efflux RND transporter permease subunit [Spirochaetia bacterium]